MAAHLQRSATSFKLWNHTDLPGSIQSPADFARASGFMIDQITKSLLLASGTDNFAIAVCPVQATCDFPLLAAVLQVGRLKMASSKDLGRVTGYPRNGVSPLGLDVPVVLDETCTEFETILIGAGVVGTEVEIAPLALVTSTRAVVAKFAQK